MIESIRITVYFYEIHQEYSLRIWWIKPSRLNTMTDRDGKPSSPTRRLRFWRRSVESRTRRHWRRTWHIHSYEFLTTRIAYLRLETSLSCAECFSSALIVLVAYVWTSDYTVDDVEVFYMGPDKFFKEYVMYVIFGFGNLNTEVGLRSCVLD